MARKPKKIRRMNAALKKALERALIALLAVLCVAAFYLAAILAESPADQALQAATPAPQAALPPTAPQQIGDLGDFAQLTQGFPAPVLAFSQSADLTFLGGLANDLAFEGAFARLLTLTYQTPGGDMVRLVSIYPAKAFSLLPGTGYALEGSLTAPLAGMTAVRMESSDSVRLHARGEQALYALTAPSMTDEELAGLNRQAALVIH